MDLSGGVVTLLMFGSFFLFALLGVPMVWVSAGVGLIVGFMAMGPAIFSMILFRVWGIVNNFSLLAVPMFILMANLLRTSGITDDLFDTIRVWMGPVKGSLAIASVVACAILGAMVGTAGAGVIIMGLIALPIMLKYKYNKKLALGSIMAGGGLGVLIPPSMMFVLYGTFTGISVGKLLIGGIGPGLLLAGLYIAYILIRSYHNPKIAPAMPEEERGKYTFWDKIVMTRSMILPILLMITVTGSIFLGVTTPSEAAGAGAFLAFLIAVFSGNLNWNSLKEALMSTMKTVGLAMWVTFGASIFVGIYILLGGGDYLQDLLLSLPLGSWGILIVINIILFFLGMIIDVIGLVILAVPIFVPIVEALGFDPLWFGVLFNINLQLAYLSPPLGYAMFYLKGVTPPKISMQDIYSSVWPFMIIQAIGIALVMLFPKIATYLPSLM